MDDLISFLRERLDEDDQVAREAEGDCWHECNDASLAFHERFGAARVLREVEVKREILDRYERSGRISGTIWPTGRPPAHDTWRRAVRLLALPYADHEDYREKWSRDRAGE